MRLPSTLVMSEDEYWRQFEGDLTAFVKEHLDVALDSEGKPAIRINSVGRQQMSCLETGVHDSPQSRSPPCLPTDIPQTCVSACAIKTRRFYKHVPRAWPGGSLGASECFHPCCILRFASIPRFHPSGFPFFSTSDWEQKPLGVSSRLHWLLGYVSSSL